MKKWTAEEEQVYKVGKTVYTVQAITDACGSQVIVKFKKKHLISPTCKDHAAAVRLSNEIVAKLQTKFSKEWVNLNKNPYYTLFLVAINDVAGNKIQ